jgi:phosphoribosylamine--glycine ligase
LFVAATRRELEGITPIDVWPEACVGVVLCSAGYPGPFEKGKPISGLTDAARLPSVQLFHAGTATDGGRLVTAGGRVLVVTATGPSLSEAAARVYEAAGKIEFDGKHLRHDIPARTARQTRM